MFLLKSNFKYLYKNDLKIHENTNCQDFFNFVRDYTNGYTVVVDFWREKKIMTFHF